jgi:hypothetical protein
VSSDGALAPEVPWHKITGMPKREFVSRGEVSIVAGAAVGGINETIHATQQVLVARVGAQESNMGSLFITTSP